jgi:hypothetical protein
MHALIRLPREASAARTRPRLAPVAGGKLFQATNCTETRDFWRLRVPERAPNASENIRGTVFVIGGAYATEMQTVAGKKKLKLAGRVVMRRPRDESRFLLRQAARSQPSTVQPFFCAPVGASLKVSVFSFQWEVDVDAFTEN